MFVIYLRCGVDEVSKEWKGFKKAMWNNFYVAMPHASQKVEDENIAVDQA